MTIKIMGGLAKSRSLFVPKGLQTRPTSVLLKRRLFDSFQNWEGYSFVDLCAGSGSVGFEAWSRGASSVTLVENHKLALQAIKNNVKSFTQNFPDEVAKRPLVLKSESILKWIKIAHWTQDTILFLDPPYEDHKLVKEAFQIIMERGGFHRLWLESDRTKGLNINHWEGLGFVPDKVYQQGTSYVAAFAGS